MCDKKKTLAEYIDQIKADSASCQAEIDYQQEQLRPDYDLIKLRRQQILDNESWIKNLEKQKKNIEQDA